MFSVFFEKLSNLLGCKVRFPMRMSPEIAIFILFRRCLRPQARFGAQPPLAAALSAKMRRNSARLVSRFRKFFDTLKSPAKAGDFDSGWITWQPAAYGRSPGGAVLWRSTSLAWSKMVLMGMPPWRLLRA